MLGPAQSGVWAGRECRGGPQPLGASSPADRCALPAMPSSHDCHASCQVSPQQDGCAQQVQGESLAPFETCISFVGVSDSLCILVMVHGWCGVTKGLHVV